MRPRRPGCFASVTIGQRTLHAPPAAGLSAREARPTMLISCRHCPALSSCTYLDAPLFGPAPGCQRRSVFAMIPQGRFSGQMGLVPIGWLPARRKNVLGTRLPAGQKDPSRARDHLRPTGPCAAIGRRCAHGGPRHGRVPGGARHTVAPCCRRRRAHPAARAHRLAAAAAARKRRHAAGRRTCGPRAARVAAAGSPVSTLANAAMALRRNFRAELRDML